MPGATVPASERINGNHSISPGARSMILYLGAIACMLLTAAGVDGLVRAIREKSWRRARPFTVILRLVLCVAAAAWLFRSMTVKEMLVP
jgi:NADH:ubiquinone oxidoreductase subunit 6 (subunit J)